MPKLRAKDSPYGLAPIRVTEAESKPSTLVLRREAILWVQIPIGLSPNTPPEQVTLGRQPFARRLFQ